MDFRGILIFKAKRRNPPNPLFQRGKIIFLQYHNKNKFARFQNKTPLFISNVLFIFLEL